LSSNWQHEAAGKDSKPRKREKDNNRFVVVEEGTNAKDEQQESSWDSEGINRMYAA
jgi:hypothetical protein